MATILIIEDEEMLRTTLQDRLIMEGFQVYTAADGQEGLRWARNASPDLILCDIMLPELDGYGVLRALQADLRTAAIPFVFLTAKATPLQVRVGMGVGADDYLCKPVATADLMVTIRARLWKQAQRREQIKRAAESARLGMVQKLPQELLVPLTGLLSIGQLLETTEALKTVEELKSFGRLLRQAADRVQRTTRRFFLAELEMASLQPETQWPLRGTQHIPATAWVTALATHLARQHDRRGDLRLELSKVEVIMSASHFSELVAQLLDNAFKFSAPGRRVTIQLSLLPAEWCELAVSDQGRGMTPEQVEQAGKSLQINDLWSQPGLGLGLASVKQLTTLYGGQFTLVSQPAEGTRFLVRLPHARPGSLDANPLEPELLQKIALALAEP